MRTDAGIGLLAGLALLLTGCGDVTGPAAGGSWPDGPLACGDVEVPRAVLDGPPRAATGLEEQQREALRGAEVPEVDLSDWWVVEADDERLALLRELPAPEDLGGGDVRTHEHLLVDRDWPDGRWHLRSASPCALTVPLGRLARADTLLGDGGVPAGPSVGLLVTERACNSGEDARGRVAVVGLRETDTTVSVVLGVRPRGGAHDCPANPPTPYTLDLQRPLGDRWLVDASVVPARVLREGTVVGSPACGDGVEVEAAWVALEDGARGTTRDPVEAAESWLAGRERFGDRLVVADRRGDESAGARVGVERDGRLVVVLTLLEADDGTLLHEGYEMCSGALG